MRRTCNPEKLVRIWHGAPSGKSSAWFEHSIDNREAAGSIPASRTKFLRASEPVSCWPHKPCEWRSTRQPATKFGGVVQREDRWPATSRPEAKITADLIRGQGDRRGFASGQRVQFPPLPPISPG